MMKTSILIILFITALFAQGNPALDFDGSDDYVDCGNDPELQMGTHDLTVEFWLKTSASAVQRIISNGGVTNSDDGYSIWMLSNGKIRAGLSDGTTSDAKNTNLVVNDGNWHHCAVVFDRNDKLLVCVDGTCVSKDISSLDGNDCNNDNTTFVMGRNTASNANNSYTGSLDEVRIWNTALSESTFEAWMYKPIDSNHDYYSNSTSDNLKAYYVMSNGSGTSLTDNSANSNTGTLTNMDDDDWVTSNAPIGCTINGNSGFRMMSSPVDGQIYSDLLSELWTQGMSAGGDVSSGDNNVWTYSGSGWTDVTDISGSGTSLTAGQGFLVYVYTDTDNDGDADLPVTLSVAGTENSGNVTVPSSGSISDEAWEFAGNPYPFTIDWDDVTQTNVTTSAYVWDSQAGTPAYISWNGTSGSLTAGLIAPYQGFWVQGSSGSGSITIAEADKSSTAGSFYKTMADNTGSMSFSISSGEYTDQTFVSFMNNGEAGMDNSDAYKLLPMSPSERVVGISYAEGNGLAISNPPYSHEGSISISLDVMYLTLDDDYNFVTNENDVTLTWDLSSLPETIIGLTLTDNTTNTTTNLLQSEELTFTTIAKGSFPAYGSNGVNIYPQVGESQFTLTVAYSALTTNDDMMPKEFALHPAYPNPFNPSTMISFDVPELQNVSVQIFNITGQLIETLINGNIESGKHKVLWNARVLPSGIYLAQLKSGERTVTQKLTLLK